MSELTYRPTVRYPKEFQKYIDSLFHSTTLDRNQLFRLALYVLGHTSEGLKILEEFQKTTDVPIPLPTWELFDSWNLWLGRASDGVGEGNVKQKLDSSSKPKNPPIKIHSLSYTIMNMKGEFEYGEAKGNE